MGCALRGGVSPPFPKNGSKEYFLKWKVIKWHLELAPQHPLVVVHELLVVEATFVFGASALLVAQVNTAPVRARNMAAIP